MRGYEVPLLDCFTTAIKPRALGDEHTDDVYGVFV